SLFIPSSNPMVSKILHINISGMVFPMAEPAYQALQDYLDSVRKYFARHVGREEIVADLESRMAEHFSAKVSSRHQVLLQKDVQQLLSIMGQVEGFAAEGVDPESEEGIAEPAPLYRDTENALIGGVCAGLGHYLKIDPLLVRLVFFLSLFAGGLGLLIYIVL